MFPLLAAFLLAAWLIQPWSYIDPPGSPVLAQSYMSTSARSPNSHPDAPDRLFAKEQRLLADATPPATVAPSPSPAPITPTPPTTPTPAPVVQPLPADGLEALVCSYAWPCQEALAVAGCESGVDAKGNLDGFWASSRTGYGLFQINPIHVRRFPDFWESWMDPAKNTAWAFQIWSEQGWRPWACRPR
jgi:hypothetical protein